MEHMLFMMTKQSQIQDFPKEGARFRVKCHVDAIQWGGGTGLPGEEKCKAI